MAGIGICVFQTPMYRATTALEIQDNKDAALAMKMLNQTNESTPADTLTDVQTQMRILQSKTLIDRTLTRLQADSSETIVSKPSIVSSLIRLLPGSHAAPKRQDLIDKLGKQLKVSQSGQTRVIELSFEANDPIQAARFANGLTSEFIQANMEARLDLSRHTTDLLLGQVDDLRTKLRTSEDALQSYARRQGLIYTNNESLSEEKLKQLQTELSKAEAERVERQSRAEVAHSVTAEAVPDVLNDTNLRAMESSLTDLRRQEADLRVVFKPDYSKAKRIQAEIETLEAAIATKRGEIISRVDHELMESKKREQLLAGAYALQMRSVADDSEKSIQYDLLKHEAETNRQIYQAMLQRVKRIKHSSAMKATNVRVLDQATPPEHPYKPNLPVNIGAGLVCGLMLGVVVVVGKARNNASVSGTWRCWSAAWCSRARCNPGSAAGARSKVAPVQTIFSGAKQFEAPEPQTPMPRIHR